ncbi:serine/threonine-protein kinase [Falsiroseomonas sp. HW251]|uniref:serine/threonine-protein kinase n=1 Tax=Falsiroseomonas sp. HW251 TaxID=3390998 RepID=UPI003D321CB6
MMALPERIGRYVVEAQIGGGAMGVILRAHDPDLDRRLAIKLIAKDLLQGADGAEYVARFQREARASSRCPHPNIAMVHDFGLHDGQPFLAMEFVAGNSLAAEIAGGRRFGPAEAVHVMGQVLDGLSAAHAAGIVHRDIKPSNILLTPDLVAKIVDFGIARLGGSELTRVGDMIGTPSYMSPEQCLGNEVDGRSDLFSAGAVLYEMLSGLRAFAGGSIVEVVRRVVDAEPPPLPPELLQGFPALAAVLHRALAKRAETRFPSAEAMARALRASIAPAAPGPAADATTVQASPHAAGGRIDDGAIRALERHLAAYIGPVAGAVLRDALRQARSREELVEHVASTIQSATDRARFLAEVTRGVAGVAAATPSRAGSPMDPVVATMATPAGPPPPVDAAALDAVRRALLPYIGPLAGTLVKRAAADGASIDIIWQRLARHIEKDAERAAFLARAPR